MRQTIMNPQLGISAPVARRTAKLFLELDFGLRSHDCRSGQMPKYLFRFQIGRTYAFLC